MNRHIIIIGARCTGKTTAGRLLAARLGCAFADVDDLIEANAGKSIAEIFASEGESGFRDRESAALVELCARPVGVIATGGGAILREANRRVMRESGFVVYLTTSPETLWERLQRDPTTASRRPNLTASGGLDEVKTLLAARESLYREPADCTITSDDLSPEAVADAIFKACNGGFTSR